MKRKLLSKISVFILSLAMLAMGCGARQNVSETASAMETGSAMETASAMETGSGIPSETAPNEELRQLLIAYYEIPEEDLESTRYYYNYVDLNDDGTEEILALAMGPYTSGSGGSSALWIAQTDKGLQVTTAFSVFNAPVIISDTITNGYHELVVPYYGTDAEEEYSILSCQNGTYTNVPDGTLVNSLNHIQGTTILANDFSADF